MTKKVINALIISGAAVLTVGAIFGAPFSRMVYAIWDNARTNSVIAEMENKKNSSSGEEEPEVEINRRAFLNISDNGYKYDFLVLVDDTNYELSHYERNETSSVVQYHTQGDYTIADNVVTLTDISDDVSNLFNNGNYSTGNDATSRKTLFDSVYSSTSFALQSNGTFVNGGTSDTTEAINSLAEVYYLYDSSSRPNYKTIALFKDNTYIVTGFALNSKNHEEAAGSFLGRGNFTYKEKDVVPMESNPDKTYSVLSLDPGYGYDWASNNGSLMGFDCISASSFNQWYQMSLSGTATAETRVSKTGYSYMSGAKTESFGKYSLSFVDTGSDEPDEPVTATFPFTCEVPADTEGNKPFVLTFNEDGTLSTGWNQYADMTIKSMSWVVKDGALFIDPLESGYTATFDANTDGSYKVSVDFGQMGKKDFTVTAEQFALLTSASNPVSLAKAEVAATGDQASFVFDVYLDGTVVTGWPQYISTMKCLTWDIENDVFVVNVGESGYTVTVDEKEDGTMDVTVDYGRMGSKVYSFNAEQVTKIKTKSTVVKLVREEVAADTEGKKPFVLEFYSDNTLVTGWEEYASMTLKTVTWKFVNGALTIDAGDSGYTFEITANADGSYTVAATFGQMGTKNFTVSADDYATLKATVVKIVRSEVAADTEGKKPFVLEFYEDGSVVTGWEEYASMTLKTVSWKFIGSTLTIDAGESGYTFEITANADGSYTVAATFGQMGTKNFTLTAEEVAKIKAKSAVTKLFRSEVAADTEGKKPFVLEFYSDNTLVTGWEEYASMTLKTVTWKFVDGALTIDAGDSGYTFEITANADGSYAVAATFGQMGTKNFIVSAENYAALRATVTKLVRSEVAADTEGKKPFVLEFYEDGSAVTGWEEYASMTLKTVTWKFVDGALTIDAGESGYTFEITANDDGSYTVAATFGQMGTKNFTVSAENYAVLKATVTKLVRSEVAADTEGKKPFVLEFYEDGSAVTGWEEYASMTLKTVTWKFVNGALTIDAGESGYTFEITANADGSYTVAATFGQMGTKNFTLTAADVALLNK